MRELRGKIALITGASSGIGASCARLLAHSGCDLLLCARRKERIESLAQALSREYGVRTLPIALDVRDRGAVEETLGHLPQEWEAIDILVNNAGLALGLDPLYEGNVDDWETMIDTNIKGLLYVTRAILPGMVRRNSGHVVNMGSIAGLQAYPKGSVYCATKAAVHFISDALRMELVETPIRVTVIEPGLVQTEFSLVRFHGDLEKSLEPYKGIKPLTGDDIAECVLFAVLAPPHVQINSILVTATHQASATLVAREE